MDLHDLVRKVLKYRGFSIISDSSTLIVRGTEGEYIVFVLRNYSEREAMERMEIEGKRLVISLEPAMEPLGELFWSREDFEMMLGSALLDEALGHELPSDVISSFEDAFIENREPVARYISIEEDDGMTSISELIPFHAISYSVEWKDVVDAGVILVDAVDGSPYIARSPFIATSEEPVEQRREPEISAENSLSAALEHLMSVHSTEVENKIETGAVTVVEKKRIGPSSDDIHTSYMGLVYIPTVFMENEEGTVAVDASGIMGFRKHY